jgi:plastocyanin
MRMALLPAALLAAVALAGCSGDDHQAAQPATCPDGSTLSPEQVEALPDHHADGFDATDHCPVPPSVTLSGLPATLGAFRKAAFSWTLDNGSAPAHSMLTSIRYGTSSVPDADLTAVTKYPEELIKREHQDLPITYHGNLTFSQPGTYYLRAYMEVRGDDHWSPEVVLQVTPVQATGTVIQFTHGPGDFLGEVTPESVDAVLGDAVQLVNEDVRDHTCTYARGPVATAPLTAAGNGGVSEAVVLVAPGVYEFECDELQPKVIRANVRVE